eukprot:TRINITY_DN4512_c0_g1_i1.p1 TRINITY_DN4512_c0_g1~~TRINITY_DN4512_c0_g1_i1.p1  ORF type:complete len:128 (-),score=17.69 TRINITY_DN4512_c0_g1_i1:436-819(-)
MAAVLSLSASAVPAVCQSSLSLRNVPSSTLRVSIPPFRPFVVKRPRQVVMMSSIPQIDIAKSIEEAQAVCADPNNTEECAVAWDEVEELSAEAAHAKARSKEAAISDPLEKFCADNPETDECRTYED